MPAVPNHPRISIDETHLVGKPRITGTRIGVDLILRNLAAGATIEWLLEGYPDLTDADIRAALVYAADQMKPSGKNAAVAAE
jgi:uncharacterized protein (DUF433 family)